MKIVLIVLIFWCLTNLISSFQWFNFGWYHPVKQISTSSNTYRPTFQNQRSVSQQQNHVNNITSFRHPSTIISNKNNTNYSPLQRDVNRTQNNVRTTNIAHRQADNIKENNNRTIYQNRFRAVAYQQQQRKSPNNPVTTQQVNRVLNKTNNRMIYSRFRALLSTSHNTKTTVPPVNRRVSAQDSLSKSIIASSKTNNSSFYKNKIQSFPTQSSLARSMKKNTKSSLFHILTTKSFVNNKNNNQYQQRRLDDYHFQQRLKAFLQHENLKNTRYIHSNMNSAIKQ